MRAKGTKLGWLVLAAALMAPDAALGQGGPGPGPGGCPGCGRMGGRGAPRNFDASTVTTVQGQIADIQRFDGGRGGGGVHLSVAVGSETIAVHLGPAFYVDAQSLELAKGDTVEVKGSRITLEGVPAIIAQEVRKGDRVLALRDASGVPLWRGQGRGRR